MSFEVAAMTVKDGYKVTEVGVVPEEWEVKQMSQIAEKIGDGLHGTPQYDYYSKYYFINGNNLIHGRIIINNNTKSVSLGDYKKQTLGLNRNTLLISLNGTIGNLAIYRDEEIMLGKSAGYIVVNYQTSMLFIYFSLQTYVAIKYFDDSVTGTTIRNLSLASLRNMKLPIPPLPEQEKIAEILSTVDEHIGETEELIEKTETLKQGMMQKLLTQGIGHTEFKDTEIGRIPTAWEVTRLKNLVSQSKNSLIQDGDWVESEHITDSGIRLIQTGNIGLGLFLENNNKKFISEDSFVSLDCNRVLPGDILICRMADPVGRSCIVPDVCYKMITAVDCVILRNNDSFVNTGFLNYYFNSATHLAACKRYEAGTTRRRISRKNLEQMLIPTPPLPEQEKIAEILSTIDFRIDDYKSKLESLNQLKKGLMQQLLTGKIRVKV